MTEQIHRYELTFMPKLSVRVDADGEVIGCDIFISDAVVNCFDAVTGTFRNWGSTDTWEELGDGFRERVISYLQTIMLVEQDIVE